MFSAASRFTAAFEETEIDMQSEKPKGFVKNIENIWYHYKYVILALVIALVVFITATVQFFSKKEPDIFIYHITSSGLTASSQDDFRESMKLIVEDYNGDGVVAIDFKEDVYILGEIKTNPTELSTIERFKLELALGECVIYIMDENFYKGNREYMCNLSDVLGYTPEFAYDEKAIRLSDLPGYPDNDTKDEVLPGLKDFSEDSFLCIRLKRTGMDEQKYEYHVDFFKKLVEFGITTD